MYTVVVGTFPTHTKTVCNNNLSGNVRTVLVFMLMSNSYVAGYIIATAWRSKKLIFCFTGMK